MVELFGLPFQICDCFDSPHGTKAYFENTATLNSPTISFLSLLCFSSLVISMDIQFLRINGLCMKHISINSCKKHWPQMSWWIVMAPSSLPTAKRSQSVNQENHPALKSSMFNKGSEYIHSNNINCLAASGAPAILAKDPPMSQPMCPGASPWLGAGAPCLKTSNKKQSKCENEISIISK